MELRHKKEIHRNDEQFEAEVLEYLIASRILINEKNPDLLKKFNDSIELPLLVPKLSRNYSKYIEESLHEDQVSDDEEKDYTAKICRVLLKFPLPAITPGFVAMVREDEELCKLHAKAISGHRNKSQVFTRLSQKMKSFISRVSIKQTP
jgi:hypothetical protein